MKRIHPTNNYSQVDNNDPQRTEGNTQLNRMYGTQTKGPLSHVPSEANPSPYSIIEKHKLIYIDYFTQFSEMHFIETMAGLKPREEKQQLLEHFMQLYEEMVNSLLIIQQTIFTINFDAADFHSVFNIQPQNMLDLIYKDIKTLEGIHVEMVYSSSLRYYETVLEAQEMDMSLAGKIYELDIKAWSQRCLNHIFQFKASPRNHERMQRKSFCQKMCPCFFKSRDDISD